MGLTVVAVMGIVSMASTPATYSPSEVARRQLVVVLCLISVSGLLQRIMLVHHLQALGVVFSQTFVHMATQSAWVRSVQGSVQHETYAFIGPQSNIGLAVWIAAAHLHSSSKQPVLPELLADSEE
jgi:hypothetical protein